jgi:hypothetical protein
MRLKAAGSVLLKISRRRIFLLKETASRVERVFPIETEQGRVAQALIGTVAGKSPAKHKGKSREKKRRFFQVYVP